MAGACLPRYAEATQVLSDVCAAMAGGSWRLAHELCQRARGAWRGLQGHAALR